jgi:hypothetical protein
MTVATPRMLERRGLPAWGRGLVVVLAVYALAVILPDTLRVFPVAGRIPLLEHWYPLGKLGFEADNDGRITAVESGGPASLEGIQVGDVIDLGRTEDRRAVNKFVFVAHGRTHRIHVARRGAPAADVTIEAYPEILSFPEQLTLLLAQVSGLFFIWLCTLLVWRHPTPQTWGLFLYGTWFNSGQYFVWYANLPDDWLRGFDYLQAVFQALGLTGILLFALTFPRDVVEGWRLTTARLLLFPAAALLGFGLWSFRNFTHGEPTETPYQIYYYLTWIVYLATFGLFAHTYRIRVTERPRIRWVILAALWALLCFLVADVYEATAMFEPLRRSLHVSLSQAGLNLLYAQSVWFPIAVLYAIRRYRVINVRFVITRALVAFVFVTGLVIVVKVGEFFLEHALVHAFEWLEQLRGPVVVSLGVAGAWVHSGAHRAIEMMIFRKWHQAEKHLRGVAERLADAEDLRLEDVDRAILDEPVAALGLTSGALFRRTESGRFERERTIRWPEAIMRTLGADDPIVASLRQEPLRLGTFDRVAQDPPVFSAPALAVPIVAHRSTIRIAVFGPHQTDEDLDGDEIRVLREIARTAAIAYIRLETDALRREVEALKARLGTQADSRVERTAPPTP